MSLSPALFGAPVLPNNALPNKARTNRPGSARHWLPVLCALVFICFTSTTFMGGSHTQTVVNAVWKAVLGTWHRELTGPVNAIGRKVGHFFGYGVVSLIFRNAWYRSARAFAWVMRSWLTPFAASLAVASTFAVACLDEWHQTFLVGRVGSLHDALLDTAGAIFLNGIVWTLIACRQRNNRERNLCADKAPSMPC